MVPVWISSRDETEMKSINRKRRGTLDILIQIANLVNETTENLSIRQVANKVGCTWRTAKRCVTILTALDWIARTGPYCSHDECSMVRQWIGTNERGFCIGILKKPTNRGKARDFIRMCMLEKKGIDEYYDISIEEAFFMGEALMNAMYFKMYETFPLKPKQEAVRKPDINKP